jgi:hypothetical protein
MLSLVTRRSVALATTRPAGQIALMRLASSSNPSSSSASDSGISSGWKPNPATGATASQTGPSGAPQSSNTTSGNLNSGSSKPSNSRSGSFGSGTARSSTSHSNSGAQPKDQAVSASTSSTPSASGMGGSAAKSSTTSSSTANENMAGTKTTSSSFDSAAMQPPPKSYSPNSVNTGLPARGSTPGWIWVAGAAGAGLLGYSMMGGSANRQSAGDPKHPNK